MMQQAWQIFKHHYVIVAMMLKYELELIKVCIKKTHQICNKFQLMVISLAEDAITNTTLGNMYKSICTTLARAMSTLETQNLPHTQTNTEPLNNNWTQIYLLRLLLPFLHHPQPFAGLQTICFKKSFSASNDYDHF